MPLFFLSPRVYVELTLQGASWLLCMGTSHPLFLSPLAGHTSTPCPHPEGSAASAYVMALHTGSEQVPNEVVCSFSWEVLSTRGRLSAGIHRKVCQCLWLLVRQMPYGTLWENPQALKASESQEGRAG